MNRFQTSWSTDMVKVVCWRAGLIAFAAAPVFAVLGVPVQAQASTPSGANFTFSGAVNGNLHLSASGCKGDGGRGNGFQFNNSLTGFNAYQWLVNVSAPKKSGTWKTFPPGIGLSIVLQASTSTVDYFWYVKSGVLTTSGTTGSLNVKVGPDPHQTFSGKVGKGTIHIVATWNCAAGY